MERSSRIFSHPQAKENSRQYLLLRTDISFTENSRWVSLSRDKVPPYISSIAVATVTWRIGLVDLNNKSFLLASCIPDWQLIMRIPSRFYRILD